MASRLAAAAAKNRSDYRREDIEVMRAGPPLDLSFKNASTIDELAKHSVQSSRVGRLPDKRPGSRYLTSSLWLSNNSLTSTAKLEHLAKSFLVSPGDLCWLDLAYNKIHDLGDELLRFQNLTILYLHGNDIADMQSLVKLRRLPKLRTLTLHGNPIERRASYRSYVIGILPCILNLDFSPVIEAERRRALPTGFRKTIQLDL